MRNINPKIKVGILGMASIAKRSFIPAIKKLNKEFIIVAIASKTFSQKEIDKEFKNIILYSSYEELISSKKIDAIYISLPNSYHYKWTKRALENNIHVICEKPLTCYFHETKILVELAIKNDLVLMETFQFRFHSQFQQILKIIRNNEIGKLRSLKSSFCFPPFIDKNNIRYKRHLGGGSLLDAGCYTIKIAQLLLGEGLQVTASSLNKENDSEVDIWGSICLEEYKNKVSSFLTFGFDNYYQCNIEIIGQSGKLSTNRIFTAPKDYIPSLKLEIGQKNKILKINSEDQFVKMLEHFYKLINNHNVDDLRYLEYSQIKNQAYLIDQVKEKANKNFLG